MSLVRDLSARRGATRWGTLALAAAMLAACGSPANEGSGDELKIGLVTDRTGIIAFAGKTFAQGVLLAEKELNAGDFLGEGRTIKVVEKEGAAEPARSSARMKEFAADKNIDGVIGGIFGVVAQAQIPIANKAKMPFMIYGADDPGLPKPPYIYRSVTLPVEANRIVAEAVLEEVAPSSAAYVVTQDNPGMKNQVTGFTEPFDAAGVDNLGTVDTLMAQTDFAGPATNAIGKKPDVIALSAVQQPEAAMVKELRSRGFEGLIIGNETLVNKDIFEAIGDPLVGVPFGVYFYPEDTTPQGDKFAKAYESEYGEVADSYAAMGYMSLYALAGAAKEAEGDLDRATLSSALGDLEHLTDTIYGDVKFDGGQMSAEAAVKIVAWQADKTLAPWQPEPIK